jgi:putative ABC transport system substrate-binding protein
MEPTIGSKWLQLLKEIAPGIARVAIVFNPDSGAAVPFLHSVEAAAQIFNVKTIVYQIHSPADIATAIESFAREPSGGLISLPDGFSPNYSGLFAELTARHGLPAIYPNRVFMDVGGLVSYAPDFVDQYRQAATYIDRILRGEKPADLPVQQPTKFELVINLKAAKALGLDVPITLRVEADELIE